MNQAKLSDRQTNCRTLLGKQPARTFLLDASPPLPDHQQVVTDLCNSLENVLSVACNIAGPSRMPLFSMLVLTSYPEMLLPLSYVKNNFVRLQHACADLREAINDIRCHVLPGGGDCVVQGLQEACAQFRRQTNNTTQQGGLCNQLEVIVVSCRKADVIQRQIEAAVSTLALDSLKRIQIVSLTNLGSDSMNDDQSEDSTSQGSATSNNSGMSSIVDVIHLDIDPLCLQNFFSSWLIDSSTDSEHLHIVLPPAFTGNTDLVIKCDLHEKMLNPAQLPFHGQFTLHPDSVMMKTFPTTSKALGLSLPIFRIQVNGLMNASAICDSVVFGMPMIAQPTACWKIDWDDLERNQQTFQSLVHVLLEKEMVMMGQLENALPNISTKRSHEQNEDKPQGCFVFLPAKNGTLLVKSVAAKELLLPFQPPAAVDNWSDDTIQTLQSSLEKLEVIDVFNPLLWPSRLYECLKSKQKKAETRQSKKRQDDTTPQSASTSGSVPNLQRNRTSVFNPHVSSARNSSTAVMQSNTDRFPNTFRGKPLLPFPTDL
ncbi:meiosis 1 arrest protein-like [Mizuhopecten yessoensis]|uniref:Meiosis 1 arrest protein n=1 Tax=Mizuhopecten yessoensis TaxID=6573 RepID=A0A210QJV5_MIZYE|nr:meiosis 1 arrest protein-like [Mizuhopecten yessoensis]OWF49024.1 Meiosis 1 arrest protein [Mizuhopecten yessoensis]